MGVKHVYKIITMIITIDWRWINGTTFKHSSGWQSEREWGLTSSPGWEHSLSPVCRGSCSGSFSLPFWPRPPAGVSEGYRNGCRSGPSGWPGGCQSSSLCCHWHPSPGSWRSHWCGSHWIAGSCRRGRGRSELGRGSEGCRLGWSMSPLERAGRWEPAGQRRVARRRPSHPRWLSLHLTPAPERCHLEKRNSLTLSDCYELLLSPVFIFINSGVQFRAAKQKLFLFTKNYIFFFSIYHLLFTYF